MSTTATLSYFYGKEADQFAFFTVPKILFTDERYKDLPCEAKMLYGMMLDRMSLSIANQWFDDQKRAYIRISTEYITENLGCGRNKALNFMKLLEEHGLIERVKHGQGKASTVYVKKFVMVEAKEQESYEDIAGEEGIGQLKDYNDDMENEPVQEIYEDNENLENEGVKFRNQTSEGKEESSEVPKLNFKKFKNQTSRSLESKPLEVYFSNPNNTDINNTDLNNNKSNPIVSAEESSGTEDEMGCDDDWNKQIQAYSVLIKENIGYSDLLMTHPLEKNLIDGIVDLILETVLCDSEKILIASNWYPAQLVKSKFLKLNYSNIEYAMYCFNGNTSKVKNIKKYLLAVLFNARSTMDGYYKAEVNHDMTQWGSEERRSVL